MTINEIGACAFGVVVGYITYRTLRRTKTGGISDIASVIGVVGGASVTTLFDKDSQAFGMYCIGLAAGFFVYLIISLFVASKTGTLNAANEWLGEQPQIGGGGAGGAEVGGGAGGLPRDQGR